MWYHITCSGQGCHPTQADRYAGPTLAPLWQPLGGRRLRHAQGVPVPQEGGAAPGEGGGRAQPHVQPGRHDGHDEEPDGCVRANERERQTETERETVWRTQSLVSCHALLPLRSLSLSSVCLSLLCLSVCLSSVLWLSHSVHAAKHGDDGLRGILLRWFRAGNNRRRRLLVLKSDELNNGSRLLPHLSLVTCRSRCPLPCPRSGSS